MRLRLASAQTRELARLRRLPAKGVTTTDLLGPRIPITRPHVFASQFEAIFVRQELRFEASRADPRILDCGANIGLVSVYLKRRFPAARITAFEADPALADAARATLAACAIDGVEVVAAAIADHDGELRFKATGADDGRVVADGAGTIAVPALRLKSLLVEPIELLKIDIEGSETDVVLDCAEALVQVRRLSVEYHAFIGEPLRLEELLAALQVAGFRYHLLPEVGAPEPFMPWAGYLGIDFTVNIFATRERG